LDFKWIIDSGVIGLGLHQLAALTTFGRLEKKKKKKFGKYFKPHGPLCRDNQVLKPNPKMQPSQANPITPLSKSE
jgi:hypothetical protein